MGAPLKAPTTLLLKQGEAFNHIVRRDSKPERFGRDDRWGGHCQCHGEGKEKVKFKQRLAQVALLETKQEGEWNHVIVVMILVSDSPMAKTPPPFRESSSWDRAAAETNPKDPIHLITLVLPSLADRVDTYGLLRGDSKIIPNSHSFTWWQR